MPLNYREPFFSSELERTKVFQTFFLQQTSKFKNFSDQKTKFFSKKLNEKIICASRRIALFIISLESIFMRIFGLKILKKIEDF